MAYGNTQTPVGSDINTRVLRQLRQNDLETQRRIEALEADKASLNAALTAALARIATLENSE